MGLGYLLLAPAIILLLVFELVARGYRVCLSTHSPQVLDAVWALKHLRENKAGVDSLLSVFQSPHTAAMRKVATAMMAKTVVVHYFDRESGRTSDISNLDPSAESAGEAEWGGLSEFSTRANSAVAHAVANADREAGQ
jgi:hypothetical protein